MVQFLHLLLYVREKLKEKIFRFLSILLMHVKLEIFLFFNFEKLFFIKYILDYNHLYILTFIMKVCKFYCNIIQKKLTNFDVFVIKLHTSLLNNSIISLSLEKSSLFILNEWCLYIKRICND